MATIAVVKKSPKITEWIVQGALLREASTGQSLLLSLNKITHYFKKWTTGSGVLKKIYCFYKNVMLQIDPPKSNYSQKQQYPERSLSLKVLRKSSSLEKVAIPEVTLASVSLK